MPRSKGMVIGFWIVTALFCLQMGFTAYAQLRLPQVAQAFTHLGFPGYFRVELSLAKLLGVVLLLAPVPARLKEWAYAGFAIDLIYRFLGLSVGCIQQGMTSEERRRAYAADVTYATANEIGFDYLRDQLALYPRDQVHRP